MIKSLTDKTFLVSYFLCVVTCFMVAIWVLSVQLKKDQPNVEYLNSVTYPEKTYHHCRVENQIKDDVYYTTCGMFISYHKLEKGTVYHLTTSSHNVIVKRSVRS